MFLVEFLVLLLPGYKSGDTCIWGLSEISLGISIGSAFGEPGTTIGIWVL